MENRIKRKYRTDEW